MNYTLEKVKSYIRYPYKYDIAQGDYEKPLPSIEKIILYGMPEDDIDQESEDAIIHGPEAV